MTTRKELLEAFDKMENDRQQLLKRLEHYSEEVLTKKPAADSWSVTETIYHLKVAELAALSYMRKKLELGGHRKATFSALVKQKMLQVAVALPIKYKAPRIAQIPEKLDVSYAQALAEWNEVRDGLKEQYLAVDENIIDNDLFKHPMAGKLSLLQSVKFMRHHMTRHIGQIDRILKAVA